MGVADIGVGLGPAGRNAALCNLIKNKGAKPEFGFLGQGKTIPVRVRGAIEVEVPLFVPLKPVGYTILVEVFVFGVVLGNETFVAGEFLSHLVKAEPSGVCLADPIYLPVGEVIAVFASRLRWGGGVSGIDFGVGKAGS